jgi:hypothetical protein
MLGDFKEFIRISGMTLGLNLLLMPGEHVLRRHITDRAVQPEIVVSGSEVGRGEGTAAG